VATQAGYEGPPRPPFSPPLWPSRSAWRKPSFTREQFMKARSMLGQQTAGIALIAKETGLTRPTVYRIKDDPTRAEAALASWGL
jgi:DNA invertase Pin-like site-specific DNA recombinase